MIGKLVEIVKRTPQLYVMARCLKNINAPELYKLLQGYYEPNSNMSVIITEHRGEKYPDEIIYYIMFNEDKRTFGFYALMRHVLEHLNFAEHLGFVPVVRWGDHTNYYDREMDNKVRNAFEYYFEPVSAVPWQKIDSCKNVILAHLGDGNCFMEHAGFSKGYLINEMEMKRLGELYYKYIHLNKTTKSYLEKELKSIFNNKRTLGIHARGSDFNMGAKGHPIIVNVEEYLNAAKKLWNSKEYDQIFLATDDLNIMQVFVKTFGNKLVYYKDVFRTENIIGPHGTFSERPLHHYKLGLEVLRDVYTLASCDALVCGLSQVSFAARYVNIALNQEFKEVVILDKGLNEKDSAGVRKYWREKKKQNRKCKP